VFRKQVNPKVAAVATLVTLVAIQWFYWRNLVYKPRGSGGGTMAGGPLPAQVPVALGMESVPVENWAGEEAGYEDGPAWAARFAGPNALAEEPDGSLLVADSRNHCIRRIAPNGRVSTLVGSGTDGVGGTAVGPAASARLRYPSGVAVARDGTVFIADTGNHRICRLKDGQAEVFAGGAAGSVDGIGGSARFNHPGALAFDRAGVLWVWDNGNRRLRRVSGDGTVSTPAATPTEISETLGMVSRRTPEVVSSAVDGKGPIAPSPFKSGDRSGAARFPSGTQVFGDLTHHAIHIQRKGEGPLIVAGRIQPGPPPIGDHEGTGVRSHFATPAAVLARPDGSVFVADYDGNRIRRLRLPTALIQ
jgi:hypothetical protein